MTLGGAVKNCFRNYATFSGRASRSEFWKFILFCLLVGILLTILNSVLFGPRDEMIVKVTIDSTGQQTQDLIRKITYDAGWFGTAFGFAVLVPTLAVAWRRMHDTGRRGWYCLIPLAVMAVVVGLAIASAEPAQIDKAALDPGMDLPDTVPVPRISGGSVLAMVAASFGSLILTIVWLCRRSQPGPNRYGPNPNEVSP